MGEVEVDKQAIGDSSMSSVGYDNDYAVDTGE